MKYAKLLSKDELKKNLTKTTKGEKLEKGGLPLIYDKNDIYLLQNEGNTLIVGSQGSGKTQSTILPIIKTSIEAEESLIINDVKGEIYNATKDQLTKKDYDILTINLEDTTKGNKYNPMTLPYELYKEGKKDKAYELIEKVGSYLLKTKGEKADPFWTNSCIDSFTGLALYLMEIAKKEPTIEEIYKLANTITSEFINKTDKNSTIYCCLIGTFKAPSATKSSIISTFNQKLRPYVARENLLKMLSKTDFNLKDLSNKKTALFVISGTSTTSSNLVPLLINQIFDTVEMYGKQEKYINIVLDEFDEMIPITNFTKILTMSRSIKIRYVVAIKSFISLVNTYGRGNTELLQMCFSNLIYLLSNDIYTLKEMSIICGNESKDEPLLSVEELKLLDKFEAIIILPRLNPIRLKLTPDYKANN